MLETKITSRGLREEILLSSLRVRTESRRWNCMLVERIRIRIMARKLLKLLIRKLLLTLSIWSELLLMEVRVLTLSIWYELLLLEVRLLWEEWVNSGRLVKRISSSWLLKRIYG